MKYSFTANVWLYPGSKVAWHFTTVPKKESADIKKRYGTEARGWGSHPVVVTIGKTTWETSVFPDRKSGTYILPLKRDVRVREGLEAGDRARVSVSIRN